MPFLGFELTSASYDSGTQKITCVWKNGGEDPNLYDVAQIYLQETGSGLWDIECVSFDSWDNDGAVGVLGSALAEGTYDVKVVSADNIESNTLTGAFTVSAGGGGQHRRMSLSIGIGIVV